MSAASSRLCWDHLIVAPLWVAYDVNLGTLLRTCDAVGACMAVPNTPHYHEALAKGDTLVRRPCIHWVEPRPAVLGRGPAATGARIVAVELADDAVPLARLEPARERTIVLLGHEHHGVPGMLDLADTGRDPTASAFGRALRDVARPKSSSPLRSSALGTSLNVAVAGSLVLYRLAGLA